MNSKFLLIFISAIISLCFSGQANAQLNLDTSYNAGVTEGKVQVYTSEIQPDGKILVGGGFSLANGVEKNTLVRLNADGSLDTTFNPGGAGPSSVIYDIVILGDGKILIGGFFTTYNGVAKSGIVRLNANGTLDTTFNSAGTGLVGTAQTFSLQSDGKILVSGSGISAYNGVARFSVIRLNTDGSLDTTFTSPFTGTQFVEEVDVQADGKILVAGSFTIGSPVRQDIARLNSDGSLDTTFNASGGGTGGDGIFAMTLQTDGKILIGGSFTIYNGVSRPKSARLNTDGSLDTTFNPPANSGRAVENIVVQTDGKVLAAGGFGDILSQPVLIRLNSDGTSDSGFNVDSADSLGYHITLQPDGKILLGGFFNSFVNSQQHKNLIRFNANGNVDSSFNPSFTGFGYAASITQQPDGKVVAAGNFNLANGTARNNVARFNLDGTLDTSFSIGAGTFPDPVSTSNIVNVITTQPDGKILVGGIIGGYNGTARRGIFRLNTDGSLDTSFEAVDLSTAIASFVNDILVLPDGKILIGGNFVSLTQSRALIRLNANGTNDATFTASPNNVVQKLLRQPDGKILVGGNFTMSGGQSRNRITRLNSDGTLDTTFNPGTGANSTVGNLALQSDGKILVAGVFTTFNAVNRAGVARLNTDGSLDTTLAGVGTNSTVESVAVQPDGKILIGGRFTTYNGTVRNRLARINADGSLDATFVSGFDSDPRFFVRRILLQSDGKLMIAGLFKSYNGISRNALAKITLTPAPTVSNGQIVFVTNRDGNSEIYKMNSDGTGVTRLTNNTVSDSDPQWSPDGTKIVFASSRDGNSEIYVMDANGGNQTRVTNNSVFDTEPTWSPDGTKIAFQSNRNGNRDIYAINANGSGETRLTTSTGFDIVPKWSPNGSQISFVSNRDGNFEIYVMSANGDSQVRLTDNPAADFSPDWSNDGSVILFSSDRDGNNEIYKMNANGSSQTRITTNSGNDEIPVWSPDNSKIVFTSDRDGNYEVYTANANGTGEQRLTNITGADGPADWQPRTGSIARAPYDFDGDGKSDIGIFRPSGGEWWITGSASNVTFAAAFGSSTDKIVPADFTGDGKSDLAFWRPSNGTWYILRSEDFSFYGFPFGAAGDVPVSADFDGDGKADAAVFRASNSGWYIQKSTGGIESLTFGTTGDSPVVADYDGDGKADIAITRINGTTREWWIRRSSDGQVFSAAFGEASDKAVQGDYTGDGKADIAIWRPSNGFWYIIRSEDFSFYGFPFGASGDTPAPGDFDGDGKFDASVFRSSNSGWYQLRSTQGFTALTFGTNGDIPIPSAFIP